MRVGPHELATALDPGLVGDVEERGPGCGLGVDRNGEGTVDRGTLRGERESAGEGRCSAGPVSANMSIAGLTPRQ